MQKKTPRNSRTRRFPEFDVSDSRIYKSFEYLSIDKTSAHGPRRGGGREDNERYMKNEIDLFWVRHSN